MPDTLTTTGIHKRALATQTSSRYEILLYESNLYDKDIHPITGVATPGLHTEVRPLTQAENLSISLILNRPGSASFEVPLQSADAMMIAGYQIKRCVIIMVDGIPEWSGFIGNLSLTAGGNLAVSVLGWMQMLYSRELQHDLVFTTIDPGLIATRLLAAANNRVANANTIPPQTMVANPSFEQNAVGSADASWSTGSSVSSRVISNTGGAFKGSKFLRFTYSSVPLPDDVATSATSVAQIQVTPGQQISLRIAMRYSVAVKNIQASLIAGSMIVAAPLTPSIGGTWQLIQTPVLTVPLGVNTITMRVSVFGSTPAGATLDLDDIYLIDVNSTVSAEDLLGGNGYFEGYLPTTQTTVSGSTVGYSVMELSDAWTRSGSRSLHSVALPNGSSFLNLGPPVSPAGIGVTGNPTAGTNPLVPVDPSTTYSLHAWVNIVSVVQSTGSSPPSCAFCWIWHDENKAVIGPTVYGTTMNTVGIREVNDTFVSPANAAYISLYFGTTSGPNQTLDCYIDCVTATKGTDPGIRNTPIRIGTVDSPGGPAKRTRTFRAGEKVGNSIEELSNIESGFDMEIKMVAVDRNLAAVSSGKVQDAHTVLRNFNIKYTQVKSGTTIYGIGQDRPEIVFALGRDPENLAGLVENNDVGRMATRFVARGQGKSAMAQDITKMNELGLWEDSANISDPGISSNTLLGYAGGEVVYRKQPIKTWQPDPKPWDGTQYRPKFWTEFRNGDIGYLSAEDGALYTAERQPIRMFGVTIQVDSQGNEDLGDIQTTAGS